MPGGKIDDLKRLFGERAPHACYVFPELPNGGGDVRSAAFNDIFVFQFWPESVEATYNPEYSTKQPQGGTHPLFQWTGGSGRDITFTAPFVSEMAPGGSTFPALLPSGRYTVDVKGAVARLQSYLLPSYGSQGTGGGLNSLAHPPHKLYLVLEGLGLGTTSADDDAVLCFLRSAPVTYEACFPDGTPRAVVVSCTFTEIVQHSTGTKGQSAIKFIGRESFEKAGDRYRHRGTINRSLGR
jgi:hypothetical protein